MDTANQPKFISSIYREHLEEASFLYGQRLYLLKDPQLLWPDLERIENRFEAHIDALVIGENSAIEVCQQQAEQGDFGEFHAAIRVFCRQDRFDLIEEALEKLDPGDKDRIKAASEALKHESPPEDKIIKMLRSGDQKLIGIGARVAGYKRLNAEYELFELLKQNNTIALSTVIWAIGRMQNRRLSFSVLKNALLKIMFKNEAVSFETAVALLRMHDPDTLDIIAQYAYLQKWPLIPIGLGGGANHVEQLINIAKSKNPSEDCLLALGLLGYISAVETLIECIGEKDLAEPAAQALNLITGPDIYEDVFIPDPIDQATLFNDELEKLKKGEPLYEKGKEPGKTISRISQNQRQWQSWWKENKAGFKHEVRYRGGKPCLESSLFDILKSPKASRKIRELAYEELVIRYEVDFIYETDMPVSQQFSFWKILDQDIVHSRV